MKNKNRYGMLALALAAMLGGCERREEPVQPPPLAATPKSPDTATLGAGPETQARIMGAGPGQCSVRSEEALQRINAARAAGRRCGGRSMGPAPALRWDQQLHAAAEGHSLDMAKRNYFEHRSPEGRDVSQRVSASRYKWKSVGENLAGGNRSISEAVDSWLTSPDHCENLMDPKYVDVAVACVAESGTEFGTYWTMVLGRR